jgi:lipopolysaccharide assembly outer membrane protein LptD (OstA)
VRKTVYHSSGLFYLLLILILSLFVCQVSSQTQGSTPKDTLIKSRTDSLSTTDTTAKKKSSQEITDTVYYESDEIDYDSDNKILTLIGKSTMKYQKITLNADTIVYDINNSLFTASGKPMLIDNADTTVGEQMVYNIKTRRGRVQYATTHLSDGYFHGARIVKTPKDEVYVDAGDYTTCEEAEKPHYFFYGKNIKIIPKDKMVSRPVVLNIGNTPVVALPYFVFPIDKNRKSGILTPSWGGHPTGGGYIENIGYYYVPNDYVDFLARGKVTEFREFVLEGASKYAWKYHLNGSINARSVLSTAFANESSQWALDYTHNQQLTPSGLTTLSGRGNLISNKKLYQESSENADELTNQNLTANFALAHRFEKLNASLNVSWDRTHNLIADSISENLPSINFNLPTRPIIPQKEGESSDSAKWYNKITVGYNANGIVRHIRAKGDNKLDTFNSGMHNAVSLNAPLSLFKHIRLTPSINAKLSTFDSYSDTTLLGIRYDTLVVYDTLKSNTTDKHHTDYTETKRDTLTKNGLGEPDTIVITKSKIIKTEQRQGYRSVVNNAWWNAGILASTNLYGLFPFRIFNFAGLRHTLSPSIGYTFTPEYNQDKYFANIGIPIATATKQKQVMTLSLENQFDGKILKSVKEQEKPSEVKFSILSGGVSASYDFEAEKQKWSDLSVNASTGIKMIRLSYSSAFWLYDQNSSLTAPIMKTMNFTLSTGSLGARGKLWGGNLLELDSLTKFDRNRHEKGGAQNWDFSFTPTYSYSMSRATQTSMFIPTKQYSLSASANINFTPNWSLSWSSNYNFTENQWVQNSINIHCDLECWDMRFQWRPERLNPGYYFVVNIKKIPEIKWEQRQ